MNANHVYQVRSLLFVEIVKIGLVLEVVRIDLFLLGCRIGQDVVGELFHLKGVAFLLKCRLHNIVQDLGMGGWDRRDGDGLIFRR